jgi:hypothetical protein
VWVGLNLAAGQTVVLTIVGTVDANFSGVLSSTAVVMPTGVTDPNLSNNQDDDQNPSPSSLSYTLHHELLTPSPVRPGELSSFSIRITNTGDYTITELPLRDVYDTTYLQFANATPQPADNNDDGQLDWSDLTVSFGQDLAPGAVFEVVVHFIAVQDTALLPDALTTCTATAQGLVGDPDGDGPLPPQPVPNAPPSSAGVSILTENQRGTISGAVFHDINKDGILDPSEKGLSDVTVELRHSTGELMTAKITTAVGGYLFANLAPGTYLVHSILPEGATPTTPETISVTMASGASLQVDFGISLKPTSLEEEEEPDPVNRIFLPILMH